MSTRVEHRPGQIGWTYYLCGDVQIMFGTEIQHWQSKEDNGDIGTMCVMGGSQIVKYSPGHRSYRQPDFGSPFHSVGSDRVVGWIVEVGPNTTRSRAVIDTDGWLDW